MSITDLFRKSDEPPAPAPEPPAPPSSEPAPPDNPSPAAYDTTFHAPPAPETLHPERDPYADRFRPEEEK